MVNVRRLALPLLFLVALLVGGALLLPRPPQHAWDGPPLPEQRDWVDYGTVLERGTPADWDEHFNGAFGAAVRRRGDYIFLYYQGAQGYRPVDQTNTWRAIGVATSLDGISFEKYAGNPILTWFPTGNGEEGAVSSALAPLGDRDYFYYGANTALDATRVNADGRLATSDDGFSFSDEGIVLDHDDPDIWASGDELFPLTAITDGRRWVVYYVPNGGLSRERLGVAWGSDPAALQHSAMVRSGLRGVPAWGIAGAVHLSGSVYALALNRGDGRTVVRTVDLDNPRQLSAPLVTYSFADYQEGILFLDRVSRTWFLYYRNGTETAYGVKLAPAGSPEEQ